MTVKRNVKHTFSYWQRRGKITENKITQSRKTWKWLNQQRTMNAFALDFPCSCLSFLPDPQHPWGVVWWQALLRHPECVNLRPHFRSWLLPLQDQNPEPQPLAIEWIQATPLTCITCIHADRAQLGSKKLKIWRVAWGLHFSFPPWTLTPPPILDS